MRTLFNKQIKFPIEWPFSILKFTKKNVIQERQFSSDNLNDNEFEEIKIPVPWGHITAVRWGPTDVQPILALHGWQDNAFTWKPLIKYLSKSISILAIDFPGHGKSSWHPPGMFYNHFNNVIIIERIKKHFSWKSLALLGHSMGAMSSFMYGVLFPNEIKYTILIDNLTPIITRTSQHGDEIGKFIAADEKIFKHDEPPTYDFETLIEKLYNGMDKSVNKEKCHILLERAVSQSKIDPRKYYFHRDPRLKHYIYFWPSKRDVKVMAQNIYYPILHFKFESSKDYLKMENYFEIFNILKDSHKSFEFHSIPGTHHNHINNPQAIADFVNSFIKKYS